MLKIIIILILIGYVFYKITSFIFSGLFSGFNRQQQFGGNQRRYGSRSRKAPNSNLNIDDMPNQRTRSSENYEGGEYVDFEEIK